MSNDLQNERPKEGDMPEEPSTETRRDVLKKGVVVAPVILTLPAIVSFARAGSGGNSVGGGVGGRQGHK
jgi:hypothetical protein